MFEKPVEFSIVAKLGTTVQEVLVMVKEIKKAHPNAKIRVEVEV